MSVSLLRQIKEECCVCISFIVMFIECVHQIMKREEKNCLLGGDLSIRFVVIIIG